VGRDRAEEEAERGGDIGVDDPPVRQDRRLHAVEDQRQEGGAHAE
jgi:hypothetical protein